MAIAFVRDLTDVTAEGYDAVVAEIDIETTPAAGLICHTAGPYGDNIWREIDVWESREAWEAFYRDRIVPAVVRVFGESILEGPPPPEPQVIEVHHLVH